MTWLQAADWIVCYLAVGEALFALCFPEVGADLLVPFALLAPFVLWVPFVLLVPEAHVVLFDLSALFVLLVPEAYVVPFVDVGHVVLLVRVESAALLVRVESVVPWVREESFLYVQVCGDAEGAQVVRPELLPDVQLFPHRRSHLFLLRRCVLLLWKVLVFYLF